MQRAHGCDGNGGLMTNLDYLNLITSEHRDKPKFQGVVSLAVRLPVQLQTILEGMVGGFDLDNPNILSFELDVIGQWVGISRTLRVPLSGVYFTWGDADSLGWGSGIWMSEFDPGGIVTLPDDVYKNLLRAKIAANSWDGTTEGAYAIWANVFPSQNLLIQDFGDMSIAIILVGGRVDSLTVALLANGYITLKPEAVHVNYYAVPVDDNKVFGWGVSSDYLGGWGDSSWVKVISGT